MMYLLILALCRIIAHSAFLVPQENITEFDYQIGRRGNPIGGKSLILMSPGRGAP
jgi:hypothetical protein